MRKKEFRIEYEKAPVHVSKEAKAAKDQYNKPKEIIDLNYYLEKRKLKVQKSQNEYHHTF